MDKMVLARRVVKAREVAGMTRSSVARAAGLEVSAVEALEEGSADLDARTLALVAESLGRPLAYFIRDPLPAVLSRRSSSGSQHDSTQALDVEVEQFAGDVRELLDLALLGAVRRRDVRVPRDHEEAEQVAGPFREQLALRSGPIDDLARVCGALGLMTFAASLGSAGPDGACVEVQSQRGASGAAVINGDAPSGRRRMTLAHELGHWLFGDAYDAEASQDSEQMINSFAIHFLAPRAGVVSTWTEYAGRPSRDRALAVGAQFRLSWSATTGQLHNLDLISRHERRELDRKQPRSGDYLRLGLTWNDELTPPTLAPQFVAASLEGFTSSTLTAARVLEVLRGIVAPDDLPDVAPSLEGLRNAFKHHTSVTPRGA